MIECTDVRKAYGGRLALDEVTFSLPSGSVSAIVGGNGAGKSTLLRCLAGIAAHTGRVRVERPLAYLPQSVALPARASARELVALFATLGRVTGVIERPNVELDVAVATLSGGQQQRAALASLFALGARTVLLDEPTANLDDHARAELFARLRDLAAGGATVLITSPAPRAGAIAADVDRVLTLERGRLVS